MLFCILVIPSSAQTQIPDSSDQDTSNLSATKRDDSVPVVEFLRTHPELLGEVKRAVIARLREQGNAVAEDSITDKMLLERLAKDETAQKTAIAYLESRGYTIEDLSQSEDEPVDKPNYDEQKSNNPTDNQDRPTLLRRKPSKQTVAGSDAESEPRYLPEQADRLAPDETEIPNRAEAEKTEKRRREYRPEEQPDEGRTVKRPSAYSNLPSLRDLYSQIPEDSKKLKRFGSDAFRRGTDISKVTIDLPVGPDYVLGPGDGLNIDIWGGISQRLSRTVDREGRIALPEAGPVVVAGLTLAQAQKQIQDALAPQFRDAKVDISVARLRTVRVYVVGDVQRPGPYDISSLSTALNALYAAGGPTALGSLRTVRQLRGNQLVSKIDLYEFLLHGVRSDVDRLQSGDTILVPPAGPQVSISGMVRRPAIYELQGEHRLSEVVDLAGGLTVTAALGNITVERVQPHEGRVLLSVNPSDKSAEGAKKALELFQVEDGDKVTIPPILPYKESTVYLQGHVARPGKYSYKEGLTINDVLRSYQDVLPEPANHAEIVRLTAPDYKPETIEFNLGDVLSGDDPIELKPFDTIRIFGRYDVDPPMVYMYGEVLRPGQYPLADGMTAGALVHMAGGLKRSAFRETGDVASYRIENGKKVETAHQTFALINALDGDRASDVPLKPGDVVTVRQLPGWKDIGASVTLNGEVVYPGTYGIEEGEKLSSVLKRAGGFRSTAYPAAALFERVEVKQLAEKSRDEVVRRIEASGISAKSALNSSGQDQAAMMQAMMQQQQQVLSRLRNQPVVGRMVINISDDIANWQNTPADIELRAGDVLTIPKRPQFVLVNGQVYNSSAQAYVPGKTAGWYLGRAGGATEMANKKSVYIVRANGSVVSKSSSKWFRGDVLSTKMKPGDVLVVPEKIVGGSVVWRNILTTAQFLSSMAFAAAALNNL